jgi:hypothetical protein
VALAAVTTCENLTYVVGVADGSGSVATPLLIDQPSGAAETTRFFCTLPTIGLLVGFTAGIRLGVIAVSPTLLSSLHELGRNHRQT